MLTTNLFIKKFEELITNRKKMWQRIAINTNKNKKRNKKKHKSLKRLKKKIKFNKKYFSRKDRDKLTQTTKRTFFKRN